MSLLERAILIDCFGYDTQFVPSACVTRGSSEEQVVVMVSSPRAPRRDDGTGHPWGKLAGRFWVACLDDVLPQRFLSIDRSRARSRARSNPHRAQPDGRARLRHP